MTLELIHGVIVRLENWDDIDSLQFSEPRLPLTPSLLECTCEGKRSLMSGLRLIKKSFFHDSIYQIKISTNHGNLREWRQRRQIGIGRGNNGACAWRRRGWPIQYIQRRLEIHNWSPKNFCKRKLQRQTHLERKKVVKYIFRMTRDLWPGAFLYKRKETQTNLKWKKKNKVNTHHD